MLQKVLIAISLSILHNYFANLTKLLFWSAFS